MSFFVVHDPQDPGSEHDTWSDATKELDTLRKTCPDNDGCPGALILEYRSATCVLCGDSHSSTSCPNEA